MARLCVAFHPVGTGQHARRVIRRLVLERPHAGRPKGPCRSTQGWQRGPWSALRHGSCGPGSGRGGVGETTRTRSHSTVLIPSRVRRTRVEGCCHTLLRLVRSAIGSGRGGVGETTRDVKPLNGPHPEPGPKDPCRGMLPHAPSTRPLRGRLRTRRCGRNNPRREASQRPSSRAGSEGPVSRDAGPATKGSPSRHDQPAVDVDGLARDIGRIPTGQEGHQSGHVLTGAGPRHGGCCAPIRPSVRPACSRPAACPRRRRYRPTCRSR